MILTRNFIANVFSILILAVINVFILCLLFGLAIQYDSMQLHSQFVNYLFNTAWLIFGPVLTIVGLIDSGMGVDDKWYYIAAIINGLLWAILVLVIKQKYHKRKSRRNDVL